MTPMKPRNELRMSLIASALLAAFGPALAAEEDEEIARLTTLESEVSAGVGYVSDDNQRFGQYTGLTEKEAYLLLDADVARRDDATGTWLRFTGRNIGLDSRLLRFEHERQGNWGYFIEWNQIPRFDPYTVNTGLLGIGTTSQTPVTITPGSGAVFELETERDVLTAGLKKALSRTVGVQVVVRNEEKEGSRRWGQGTFGTWRFLAEPIDQTTRQLDATVNYATDKLQLSGGYYATTFENHNELLTVNGPTLFAGSNLMALPPDNQSHQLHLAGGYSFTPTTRAMFKVAYGRITQDETFPTAPVAGAPGNLDGRIDTTLVEGGLTTRPVRDLTLRANLRYEDRDDRTPVFRYFPSQNTVGATNDGTNETRDIRTTAGKLEATYRLPLAFHLTGGVDYVEKKRNSPPVRSVDFRETTEETSLRAELRRTIGETLTGALAYVHSERDGSEWLTNFGNQTATTTGDLIAPLHLADRDRDLVRASLTWMPLEPLSLNFRVDAAKDDYASRGFTPFDLGPRSGEARFYSVDAGYAFSDAVQATAWLSRSVDKYENALCQSAAVPNANTCVASAANPVWSADLRHTQDSAGLGLRAKASARLDLGADLAYSEFTDEMRTFAITPAVALPALPDIHTDVTTLTLFAKYALQRNSGVRVQYVYDRYKTDDWTWNSWVYSDGTRVLEEPNQEVHFVGVAYYQRF
jgi:MtrB/PioB family decaheme-associated outer membrane protein